ncbi:MAG TPA: YihY/virulence factor BrkB family protein [Mucilaginibacter sp.]|nr:YihY/virulence factor BrkB family protein [Mucilaginibacter sp.]HVW13054.1 YihY/virulence factor BrkB family protein [Mucilaginibacter sp.]
MKWLHRFLRRFVFYRYLVECTKYIGFPGFKPISLYTVLVFFFEEISQGTVSNKASSLSYNFMLALFPATIFLFTLIPYIPIRHFQDNLLTIMSQIMPADAFSAFHDTIIEIVKKKSVGLFSFGFLTTLFFATNGVSSLMQAFNKSSLQPETRGYFRRRWVALVLTVVISLSLLVAVAIMIGGDKLLTFLKLHIASRAHAWYTVIALSRWAIVIIIFFTTVSLLYRYGPAHKQRWKFLSPGSILATLLAVLISLGFTYYIDNFSSYNKVYGSIGTLIVVMIWLYLNSLIILIGFELNASIELSKRSIKIVKPKFNTFRTTPPPANHNK